MEQQRSSRSSIGPNWSRQPLGGVKKAEVKYPGHTSLNPSWIRSLTALLRIPLSWIHLLSEKWTLWKNELSLQPCALDQPSQLLPWWEEKPPSLFTSFYSFTLVYFLSVSSCAKLRLPRTTSQNSTKQPRANAHFNDSWTLSQSATSEKPFPAKTEDKRESFKHKSCKYKPQTFAETGVILKIDFSLIEKVNASVKYVIDDCSGLCNCTYCCKRGISNSHSLNLILSSLSLFLQRVNVWMLVFMCRLVYMS